MSKLILLVDDEEILNDCAKESLLLEGYQVKTAENASQALEILKNEKIDFIVSDFTMPGLTGLELANKVRNDLALEVPFVLLTGHSDFSDAKLSLYRITKVFEKPIMFDELVKFINSWFKLQTKI